MVGTSILILGGLSLAFAVLLAFAARFFTVSEDPLVAKIEELLPGSNCGGCGAAGCRALAELLAARKVDPGVCVASNPEANQKIAALTGQAVNLVEKRVAVLRCQGGRSRVRERFRYTGIPTCTVANLTAGGPKECLYGCLGYGDCLRSCQFGAIRLGEEGLPVIDESKCVACGRCVAACPRRLITLISRRQWTYLACASRNKGKTVKDTCPVGCIACGLCAKVTKSGAIVIEDNLPRMNYEKGQDFEEAVRRCPMHCFVVRFTPQTSSGAGSEPAAKA